MMHKFFTAILLLALFVPAFVLSEETSGSERTTHDAQRTTEIVRQFVLQSTLEDGTLFDITIVAPESAEGEAFALCAAASSRALGLFSEIFSENGVQSRINSLDKGGLVKLSPEAYKFISRAAELSKISAQSGLRQLVLDQAQQTVSTKAKNARVSLKNIAYGYIVDIAMEEIVSRSFTNAKVETVSVMKTRGRDVHAPWNISISLGASGDRPAGRAFTYNIYDIAAAFVTPDGLGMGIAGGKKRAPPIKSATVLAPSAGAAVVYGIATYALGPKDGIKFIDSHPEVQGIIVDPKGALTMSKGLAGGVLDATKN